jgi:RimJ/RimL family protein N-acetyltransferase
VGLLGIFGSEFRGRAVSEAGWSVLPEHQGRGYASAGLAILLERAFADGRWGAIHAFPGTANVASNALCRKFGFEPVGDETIDYGGRTLACQHWVLDPSTGSSIADADTVPQR